MEAMRHLTNNVHFDNNTAFQNEDSEDRKEEKLELEQDAKISGQIMETP